MVARCLPLGLTTYVLPYSRLTPREPADRRTISKAMRSAAGDGESPWKKRDREAQGHGHTYRRSSWCRSDKQHVRAVLDEVD
jgi:hypothetical protein